MNNKDWGRGRGGGGLIERGGLINFPPLKRWGSYLRGGGRLNRGFTVDQCHFAYTEERLVPYLKLCGP